MAFCQSGGKIMAALKVMIIEDEVLIALLFEEVLMEMGHEVCASERTEAGAVATAAICRPELIISDVRLQDGSGIDAVTSIMRSGFIPHIFTSGDLIDRKSLNPAARILHKPFDEGQLIRAIESAIDPENVLIGEKHAESLRHE
jgi:two-component system, response regulator PdtaR